MGVIGLIVCVLWAVAFGFMIYAAKDWKNF